MRGSLGSLGDLQGNAGVARVVDFASPELRAILRPKNTACGLIASGWYDTQLVGELIELIERVAAPVDPAAFGASVGEAIAQDNVTGVHRALFRLVSSPALLEAHAQRVWRTYVDEGTLTVRMRTRGSFDARVRGWTHHHPSVCRTVRAMLESALRAAGYSELLLERTHCVGLGDTQGGGGAPPPPPPPPAPPPRAFPPGGNYKVLEGAQPPIFAFSDAAEVAAGVGLDEDLPHAGEVGADGRLGIRR